MEEYKLRFIDFMLRAEVLRFGEFVTKSGRHTPFFINTGLYSLGSEINELAGYYAERREKPELAFYDTAGTASGAVAARDRAIAEGADQILGPLGRDEVSALFNAPLMDRYSRRDLLRFGGAGSEVRCDDDIGETEQFVLGHRLAVLVAQATGFLLNIAREKLVEFLHSQAVKKEQTHESSE